MDNTKGKKMIAVLSQAMAHRDKTVYKINAILDAEPEEGDIDKLALLFKDLACQELGIEATQVFYAIHFKPVETSKKPKEDDSTT